MSRWFRFYDCVVDDPKAQRLPPHLFKTWVNLLCLASRSNGVIPPVDDVAFSLRISTTDAQAQIDELIGVGLLDIRPDKRFEPHNWAARQFQSDTSKERTRKYRKRKTENGCDVTVTAGVTPPEQRQIQIQKQNIPPQKGVRGKFVDHKRENAIAFEEAIAKYEAQS